MSGWGGDSGHHPGVVSGTPQSPTTTGYQLQHITTGLPHDPLSSQQPPQVSSILMNPDAAPSASAAGPSYRTHQRAFSHGQTIDGVTAGNHRGHKRGGSKTDFILPDGHDQREKHREKVKPAVGRTSSFPLGHKRNASRTESIYTIRENKVPLIQRIMFWRKVRFYIVLQCYRCD